MLQLGTDTLIIMRAPMAVSPRSGTQTRDWLSASTFAVKHCSFQNTATARDNEDDRSREFAMGIREFFAPPTAPQFLHTDRILFEEAAYDVLGFPHLWRTRIGRKHHWHGTVKRQEDSHVIVMPPGSGVPPSGWSVVTAGHGPPAGPIPGSLVYIDIDTGDYYVWNV